MICNRCGYQSADGTNFCSNCGVPFQQQAFQAYPPPQPFPQGNNFNPYANPETDRWQKRVFILGLISFGVNAMWAAVSFMLRFIGFRYYDKFSFLLQPLSIITTVLIVFLSFLFVKKQGMKMTLLVLFIVLTLYEIANVYFHLFMGGEF